MSETASDAAAAPTPARAGADGGVLSGNAAEQMQVLRGVKVLAEACAEALVNEPTPEVLADLRKVAAALGGGLFDGIEPDGALRQRYYDRMFVTTSPHYVPLIESSVANRIEADGRVSYGAVSSSKSDHVIRCYKTAGFDYTGMRGYEIAVKSLHPDSMASELAFMAFLAEAAVEELEAGKGADGGACAGERLLCDFARRHTRWFADAARLMAATDDDLYARVAALAAETADMVAGRAGE